MINKTSERSGMTAATKPILKIETKTITVKYFTGTALTKARQELGLSQAQLAEKLNCSQQEISKLELPIAHQLTDERKMLLSIIFEI